MPVLFNSLGILGIRFPWKRLCSITVLNCEITTPRVPPFPVGTAFYCQTVHRFRNTTSSYSQVVLKSINIHMHAYIYVPVCILPCVYGVRQEDVITCQIMRRAFAQLQLSTPCAVYHAPSAAPPAHQIISQRAFACSAVSQTPATAFLPSTPKLTTFSYGLSYRLVIAHVSKGWDKLANHFTNPDSLLQPKRRLFSFVLGGRCLCYFYIPTVVSADPPQDYLVSPAEFSVLGIKGCCVIYLFFRLWFVSLSLTSPHATPLPLVQP